MSGSDTKQCPVLTISFAPFLAPFSRLDNGFSDVKSIRHTHIDSMLCPYIPFYILYCLCLPILYSFIVEYTLSARYVMDFYVSWTVAPVSHLFFYSIFSTHTYNKRWSECHANDFPIVSLPFWDQFAAVFQSTLLNGLSTPEINYHVRVLVKQNIPTNKNFTLASIASPSMSNNEHCLDMQCMHALGCPWFDISKVTAY